MKKIILRGDDPRGRCLRLSLHDLFRGCRQRLFDRKPHAKAGMAWLRRKADVALMLPHDAVHRIQPQSAAIAHTLSREKGIEDARLDLLWNPGTVINDLHQNAVAFGTGANADLALSLHGIDGIIDKVGPDLIQFT